MTFSPFTQAFVWVTAMLSWNRFTGLVPILEYRFDMASALMNTRYSFEFSANWLRIQLHDLHFERVLAAVRRSIGGNNAERACPKDICQFICWSALLDRLYHYYCSFKSSLYLRISLGIPGFSESRIEGDFLI